MMSKQSHRRPRHGEDRQRGGVDKLSEEVTGERRLEGEEGSAAQGSRGITFLTKGRTKSKGPTTALKSAPDPSIFLSSGGTAHGLPSESDGFGTASPNGVQWK